MADRWRSVLRTGLLLIAILGILGIAGVGVRAVLGWQAEGSEGETPTQTAEPRSITHVLLSLYLWVHQADVSQPANAADSRQVSFSIAPGETAASIGPRLQSLGLIRNASVFGALARYRGVDNSLEAGAYSLSPSMTLEQIVASLQNGQAAMVTVTIPEGWRMEQVAAKLSEAGLGDEQEYLDLMHKSDYPYPWLQDRPPNAPAGLEGFLFPDTYKVPKGMAPADVIDLMLRDFDSRVTPELQQALASHGLSFYQGIVLASIVEREAVVPEERPTIAAVFLSRLSLGMYLQADPTVSYAKGFDQQEQRWWMPMYEEDPQTIDSPYNTFEHEGLTPGPICSPGLASIEAVAKPAQTNYLFFVAKGDGSHAFAETYEEHLANMQKYANQ